jgi:25S rRNA (adenine2142-N1)-methyltransferase
VEAIDFLDFETRIRRPFDVVCLSLVVNFEGDPWRRGQMLQRAHSLLRPNGLLFLVLPLACVTNSRYLNEEHLLALLDHLGYGVLKQHQSRKLAHYLLVKQRRPESKVNRFTVKQELCPGRQRNNFCILLSR